MKKNVFSRQCAKKLIITPFESSHFAMPLAENLVVINDLHFQYAQNPILQGVNLRIPHGKVVAIMGGSGCGKTTLLRAIAGQLPVQKGSIWVDGENVEKMNHRALYQYRKKLGMLFQFGALFTDMTAFDNVAFPLREHTNLPESMISDLVLLKLEAVGLRGAAHLLPRELSGGMARRVALARSIALDPSLILYDEPFTGLDPIAVAVIGKLIRELNDALGASSIMVTHDVAESLAMVDYVYFLENGVVAAEGTPDEIKQSTHPFVAQFINARHDGPAAFDYPAPPLSSALLGN